MKKLAPFTYPLLIACLLLITACSTADNSATTSSSPTSVTLPAPNGTPQTATALTMGPVPQNCSPGATPQPVDPSFGPGIGRSPAWAMGFTGPHATLHLQDAQQNAQNVRYGWPYKILWAIGPRYTHTVTLRGGSLSSGSPLWFQIGDQAITKTPALNPIQPGTVTGSDAGWGEFPSYLYIPRADCYFLEAHWPSGSWRVTFAAGL